MAEFSGLGAADFDAFEERKWASNRFNLERMRVREKLHVLGAQLLTAELRASLGVELCASQDHPSVFNNRRVDSQWAYFARSAAERKRLATIIDREHPLHRRIEDPAEHHLHAVLAVRVYLEGADVLFGIHRNAWVDARNLAARLEEPYEATVFAERLQDLPESVRFHVGDTDVSAREIGVDAVRTTLKRFTPEAADDWFVFRLVYPREADILGQPGFAREAASGLRQLAALYDFGAWRPDNDHVGLHQRIRTEKKVAKAQSGVQASAIGAGDHVRITTGLFAGREGYVLELDGKGGAKVQVGAVPIKVRVAELQRRAASDR